MRIVDAGNTTRRRERLQEIRQVLDGFVLLGLQSREGVEVCLRGLQAAMEVCGAGRGRGVYEGVVLAGGGGGGAVD